MRHLNKTITQDRDSSVCTVMIADLKRAGVAPFVSETGKKTNQGHSCQAPRSRGHRSRCAERRCTQATCSAPVPGHAIDDREFLVICREQLAALGPCVLWQHLCLGTSTPLQTQPQSMYACASSVPFRMSVASIFNQWVCVAVVQLVQRVAGGLNRGMHRGMHAQEIAGCMMRSSVSQPCRSRFLKTGCRRDRASRSTKLHHIPASFKPMCNAHKRQMLAYTQEHHSRSHRGPASRTAGNILCHFITTRQILWNRPPCSQLLLVQSQVFCVRPCCLLDQQQAAPRVRVHRGGCHTSNLLSLMADSVRVQCMQQRAQHRSTPEHNCCAVAQGP